MGKGSKQRPTNKTAFDENFDRIFGKGRRDEDDRHTHWCGTCRSPLKASQAIKTVISEKPHRRADERVVCELCGFGGVVAYDFQDLSPEEKLYLH